MNAEWRLNCLQRHLSNGGPLRLQTTSALSTAAQKVLDTRKEVKILDSYMSYLDTGPVGDKAVIFLHGNPAAAFLWRNIIPHVSPIARCLAPDLIGMGRSGKEPNNSYRMVDHNRYLSAWFDALNLPKKVTIVCHDWGSGLGFHWCNLHRDRVEAIVFFEAMVGVPRTWENWPASLRQIYQDYRTPKGEEMVLKHNFILADLFPGAVQKKLSDEEMAEYMRPYREPGESRRPLLTLGQQIPIGDSGPEDVVRMVKAYNAWLWQSNDLPKLFIDGDPGMLSAGIRNYVVKWPNLRKATAKGLHFLQEDSPDEIGQAIVSFLKNDVYN